MQHLDFYKLAHNIFPPILPRGKKNHVHIVHKDTMAGKKTALEGDPAEEESNTKKKIKTIEQQVAKGPRTIVLVWADWCPHCVTMRPAWEATLSQMLAKTGSASAKKDAPDFAEIESRHIESVAQHSPNLYKQIMSVGHLTYPTILMFKQGQAKPTKYDKERDAGTMIKTFSAFASGQDKKKTATAGTPSASSTTARGSVLPATRLRSRGSMTLNAAQTSGQSAKRPRAHTAKSTKKTTAKATKANSNTNSNNSRSLEESMKKLMTPQASKKRA